MWEFGFSVKNRANTRSNEPKVKRIKRYPSVFKKQWILKYSWVAKGKTNHHCRCTSCNSEFSVAHGGEYDVRKHMNTEKHKQSSQSISESEINSLSSGLPETKIKQEPAEVGLDETYELGKVIIEGKTKVVYEIKNSPKECILMSKDRITAGDGVKAHNLEGKAAISTETCAKVFNLLNKVGIKTAFIKQTSSKALLSKKCEMIPIEWVTRRLATGSFLKRQPGVPEGYRFYPPKHETFFKDDANHDPQWSVEQIISAKFKYNGVLIGPTEVDIMTRTSILVFEVLEKFWATKDCVLVDMKIEFGVDPDGQILVADVIDSDSWRLWPSGDKRLMVDKQVYRNLTTVTNSDLDTVRRNFEWVAKKIDFSEYLIPNHLVVILMGSPSDKEHCEKIEKHCQSFGLQTAMRVTSAHKGTEETLSIVRYYESLGLKIVFIAVAGRSNGLGPVVSANSAYPVINCPPVNSGNVDKDIWSSLNVPSGLGCATVVYPETAAIHAAQILALENFIIWGKIRTRQLDNYVSLTKSDKELAGQKALV